MPFVPTLGPCTLFPAQSEVSVWWVKILLLILLRMKRGGEPLKLSSAAVARRAPRPSLKGGRAQKNFLHPPPPPPPPLTPLGAKICGRHVEMHLYSSVKLVFLLVARLCAPRCSDFSLALFT
jgi:hypothetical protein